MPPYRLARLNPEQIAAIESLENELGLTLVAYEPATDQSAGNETASADDRFVLDALVDDYRTYDPHLGY